VVTKELPWLLVVSGLTIVLALALPGAGDDQRGFGRSDGILMLLIFAGFMMSWYRMGRRDAADPLVRELGEEAEAETQASVATAALLLLVGLVFLLAGGKLAETGAVAIARWLGLSDALIGLTIVAVATSLPELATAIIACRKGYDDLAVGNVVGSNLFNLLLVLACTATLAPVAMPAAWGLWDLVMMTVITVLLLPMTMTHGRRITRWEGGVLLALYLGYMAFSVGREMW
jgi:cation:H+ antiporter